MRNMVAIAVVCSDGHKEARVWGRQIEKEKRKLKAFLDQKVWNTDIKNIGSIKTKIEQNTLEQLQLEETCSDHLTPISCPLQGWSKVKAYY